MSSVGRLSLANRQSLRSMAFPADRAAGTSFGFADLTAPILFLVRDCLGSQLRHCFPATRCSHGASYLSRKATLASLRGPFEAREEMTWRASPAQRWIR